MVFALPAVGVPHRVQGTHEGSDVLVSDDFAEFVRGAMPGLLRYGHALTGNPHDAADLVQAVLEKVGSRWSSVQRKTGDPLAYVRRAMANTQVSMWRRRRRESLVSELPDIPDAQRPDSLENEPLWQALRELPPKQRAVIALRYYEQLTEAEVAMTLGISKGTVKSQTSKAMDTLRGKLGTSDSGLAPAPEGGGAK